MQLTADELDLNPILSQIRLLGLIVPTVFTASVQCLNQATITASVCSMSASHLLLWHRIGFCVGHVKLIGVFGAVHTETTS